PPALSDLILKLLARRAENRPPSARAVAEMLRALEEGPAPAGPAAKHGGGAVASPARPPPRRPAPGGAPGARARRLVLGPRRPWQRPPAGAGDPTHDARYRGSVDVLVWSKDGGAVRRLRLGDAGALPLHTGDQLRLEARVSPAAYLYLFWIDTDGKVAP